MFLVRFLPTVVFEKKSNHEMRGSPNLNALKILWLIESNNLAKSV